jgi:hypothetical protein
MNADRKVVMLGVLVETYLEGSILETALKTIETIDRCRDDRNFVMHGVWARVQPGDFTVVMSIRGKSNPDEIVSEAFPNMRLLNLISDIKTAKRSLIDLFLRPRSSPETQQEPHPVG